MKRHLSLLAALLLPLVLLAAPEPPPTVIECAGLAETISTDTETIAIFRKDVTVIGNNIRLYCDYLEVVAIRKGDPSATVGDYGNFKSLIATGNVRIVQGDREATCGRAEVRPGEDLIVLTENPVVRSLDNEYLAEGPELELHRGQRRAIIRGTPDERVRITLPAIKDLGFEEDGKPAGRPE